MAIYSDVGECAMADPPLSQTLLNTLLSRGVVQRGPVLMPLSHSNTQADGCHQAQAAEKTDGEALCSFFG
jgi:hypothetical protein